MTYSSDIMIMCYEIDFFFFFVAAKKFVAGIQFCRSATGFGSDNFFMKRPPSPLLCLLQLQYCLTFGDCCLDYEQECLPTADDLPPGCDFGDPLHLCESRHQGQDFQRDHLNLTAKNIGSGDLEELISLLPNVSNTVNSVFDLELRIRSKCRKEYRCVQTSQYDYYLLIGECGDPSFFNSQLEHHCLITDHIYRSCQWLPMGITTATSTAPFAMGFNTTVYISGHSKWPALTASY